MGMERNKGLLNAERRTDPDQPSPDPPPPQDDSTEPPTEPPTTSDTSEPNPPRRPGSRIHLRNSQHNTDQREEQDTEAPIIVKIDSKFPVYINEALCKSCSNLYYEARQLKRSQKISDAWTYDGRIKIKDNHSHIRSIEKLADLDKYRS